MNGPTGDQTIEFYYALFARIFADPFLSKITERLKRDAVRRQIEEAAGAASQSLTRFLENEQVDADTVQCILGTLATLGELLELKDVSNPNETPEAVVEKLLSGPIGCPMAVSESRQEVVFRVAMHSTVQVLMLVGPVISEWSKVNFATTYELPRRVISRLNQIAEQLDALGRGGQTAVDDRFELTYRDYLLQRFHRVEAGTVRMTTNLNVDLRELFVMPNVRVKQDSEAIGELLADNPMNLAAARKVFAERAARSQGKDEKAVGSPAVDQARNCRRSVIVGAPGGGKSTFFEWLQLEVADANQELVLAGKQAIPLLLRVRQLDMKHLPRGAELIEKATASSDRAKLMPPGWIHRMMKEGRVLFMLDGLDETEPELRDGWLIPWLELLCKDYPKCRYLISSRPVGYPPGSLSKLKFVECELADFEEPQIAEFARHWCSAVRLARNEPADEARREGTREGDQIVEGFQGHPYIRNLARNPLMLSAICLVNYFEGGHLPRDRAVLYKLCVEGLLHHWDQRRGIHSEFALDEKLRACREVAIAMQADDRAEYEAEKVLAVLTSVLADESRAKNLLEHIRYRTGLLMERRPGVFAFAHLTFQEYLAAQAVAEGNKRDINPSRLVNEHEDGRWREVIALYCGLAPARSAQDFLELLISQPNSDSIADVLTEAFFTTRKELFEERDLRERVIERIANATGWSGRTLDRFPDSEVVAIANQFVGTVKSGPERLSTSYGWLYDHPESIDFTLVAERLSQWRSKTPFQNCELNALLHRFGPLATCKEVCSYEFYHSQGPKFGKEENYESQAAVVFAVLPDRYLGVESSPPPWNADDIDLFDEITVQCLTIVLEQSLSGRYVTTRIMETAIWRSDSQRVDLLPPSPEHQQQWHDLCSQIHARLSPDQTWDRFAEAIAWMQKWPAVQKADHA